MELVYSVDYRCLPKSDFLLEDKTVCSLSCKNILAFSRQSSGSKYGSHFEVVHEVCVFDLDRPWEEFKVTETQVPVVYMRWDPSGSRLLVVNSEGTFTVWIMENYLINQWQEYGKTELPGEEVLVLAWLHNGIQVLFNPDKQNVVAYNEKFQRAKFIPTVSLFGNKPMDGWMAITSSGMVTVGLLQEHEHRLITASKCLAPGYLRLTQADIAFMATGEVMVAASDGTVGSAVQCFNVTVKMEANTCRIESLPEASFFLRSLTDYNNRDNQNLHVSKLCFLNRENSDVLLACCAGPGHSCLEVWHLLEQTMPLHRMFQSAASPELACKMPKWTHKASIQYGSHLTDIARPKLPMNRSHNIETTSFLSYFACTYRDGSIKIIHRQSYQVLHTSSMETLDLVSSLTGDHQHAGLPHLISCVQTTTGCGLVGQSQGSLCVFRVFNSREGSLQLSPTFVVQMLEYTMLVGYDVWDVLLAIRQGMVEGLHQHVNDNYQKQTPSIQEMLRIRLMRLRMALCSVIPSGRQRAAECRALLTLYSVSSILRSIVRPKSVTPQEKSPLEKLSALCNMSSETDLDTLIKNLDPDDFIMESIKREKGGQASLQVLQPFIQWVGDFVLHLLSTVPLVQSGNAMPGALLLRDVGVLATLRDTLAVIRLWGAVNPACLPTFATTTYHDCLGHIFKLLSKLAQMRKDGAGMDLEESLVDECASLPSKVLVPDFHNSYGHDSCSFAIFTQLPALRFTFGTDPSFLYTQQKTYLTYPTEVAPNAGQRHDIVRHIQLGVTPSRAVRECIRCGACSLLQSTTTSVLLKSWEKRFVVECLCGGHWKLS
ncbi:hypothetical protein ACOMHN_012864 [Nucella lapillus]